MLLDTYTIFFAIESESYSQYGKSRELAALEYTYHPLGETWIPVFMDIRPDLVEMDLKLKHWLWRADAVLQCFPKDVEVRVEVNADEFPDWFMRNVKEMREKVERREMSEEDVKGFVEDSLAEHFGNLIERSGFYAAVNEIYNLLEFGEDTSLDDSLYFNSRLFMA